MASTEIKDLVPEMQVKASIFSAKMAENNIPFVFTCTYRSQLEQDALYSQGRDPIKVINQLRHSAGLPTITEKQAKKVVTWVKTSKHTEGKAFDIAIGTRGKIFWDLKCDVNKDNIPDYEEAGKIGESIGLRWGGRFKFKDYVHFELAELTLKK